jgi:hypothetical protein
MSIQELSSTVEWRRLPSGTMRQILSDYISNGMQSMIDSVAAVQSRSLGPERLTEIAEQILATPSVIAVLDRYRDAQRLDCFDAENRWRNKGSR